MILIWLDAIRGVANAWEKFRLNRAGLAPIWQASGCYIHLKSTQAWSSITRGIFGCAHQADKSVRTRSHCGLAQSEAEASHLAAVGK